MIEYDFLWLEEYAGELIVVHLIFLSLCTLFLWIIARRLGVRSNSFKHLKDANPSCVRWGMFWGFARVPSMGTRARQSRLGHRRLWADRARGRA